MSKTVLVIGGFGFIGYHISKILSFNNWDVSIAHRSKSSDYKSKYKLVHLDLNKISIEELKQLLRGYNSIIFCGGADDRKMPKGDAATFYYSENVLPCKKLVEASLGTSVQKIVILGSYLSHFDKMVPQWKMKERHPYIMSRYLQQKEPVELAQNSLQVSTLEIPYVFGSAPDKMPLWKPLVDYINKMPLIFYSKGGTNIMSVEQVAESVLGVLNSAEYRTHWIIGSENVSWTELLQMIAKALGKKRRVLLIPNFIVKSITFLVRIYFKLISKQTGLDPYHYADVQTSNTFLDVGDSMKTLGYDKVDMQESINKMVSACGYEVQNKEL